jgi:hypothetical protein
MQDVSQSTLARLLATENITVVQGKVRTASFDIKNRVLTLPMWKDDLPPATTDHFVGHEVGHALFTPLEGWHEAVCDHGGGYKSFLNVVEDARIEKLIQRKYPGLRRSFIASYKSLLAEGFFGGDIKSINKMPLIDRINVYFKCGLMSGVKFTADEKQWLPRIESAETWEEVVAIVDDLYGQAKEELKEQQNQQPDEGDEGDDDNDEFDMESADSPFDMEDGESEEDNDTDDSGEEGEAGDDDDAFDELFEDDDTKSGGREGGKDAAPDPMSHTDQQLREAIDREMNSDFEGTVHNLKLAKITNSEDYIVSYKQIFKIIDAGQVHLDESNWYTEDGWQNDVIEMNRRVAEKQREFGEVLLARWRNNNQKAVNTMVKEFEMRKSASEYARATLAKTGVIDTVKMNKYKLTDDIFRKVTVVPEGKNHGFIMYLDMSGSMHDYMFETVEQTLMLANFCKQIGVPFRVFGFTSALRTPEDFYKNTKEHNLVTPECNVRLLELFSDRMNKMDMTRMSKQLLAQYAPYSKALYKSDRGIGRECRKIGQIDIFRLGGTPLNSALSVGIDFANKFRNAHQLDIINTFLLTDGASHNMDIHRNEGGTTNMRSLGWDSKHNYITLTSPYNNKTYRLGTNMDASLQTETDLITQIYQDATGSTVIGYRIIPNGSKYFTSEMRQLTGRWVEGGTRKSFLKEGYIRLDGVIGHDEMYLISVKSLTPVPNRLDDVAAGSSKMRLRSAFKASGANSKRTRRLMQDLSKAVA